MNVWRRIFSILLLSAFGNTVCGDVCYNGETEIFCPEQCCGPENSQYCCSSDDEQPDIPTIIIIVVCVFVGLMILGITASIIRWWLLGRRLKVTNTVTTIIRSSQAGPNYQAIQNTPYHPVNGQYAGYSGPYSAGPGAYSASPGLYSAGPGLYSAGPELYSAGNGAYEEANTVRTSNHDAKP